MNPDILIRKADVSDAAAIAALEKETFSSPWSENSVIGEIQKENAVFLVCEIDGAFAGYVSMETVYGECYIGNLAVNRLYRRQGAATALLNALKIIARQKEYVFISLEVRASNTAARELYCKNGFEFQGVRPGFYSDPTEDAAICTLYL